MSFSTLLITSQPSASASRGVSEPYRTQLLGFRPFDCELSLPVTMEYPFIKTGSDAEKTAYAELLNEQHHFVKLSLVYFPSISLSGPSLAKPDVPPDTVNVTSFCDEVLPPSAVSSAAETVTDAVIGKASLNGVDAVITESAAASANADNLVKCLFFICPPLMWFTRQMCIYHIADADTNLLTLYCLL